MSTPLPILFALGPEWLVTWLTPLWFLAVGALLGLLVLLALWGILALVAPRWAAEVPEAVTEGALLPLLLVTASYSLLAVLGWLVVAEPVAVLQSIPRFLVTGPQTPPTFTIPAAGEDPQEIAVAFRGDELSSITIESDQPILVSGQRERDLFTTATVEVDPGTPFQWLRGAQSVSPFGDGMIQSLYVTNLGDVEARLNVRLETRPAFPQSGVIVVTAASVVAVFLLYFLQLALLPKVSAIALSTAKSEMAQPLFIICLSLGAFLLFVFMFVPYNTFGEDIKMLKDSGFTTIMILGIIVAVWGASNSIAEEIEGKTALTVLSKPIGRAQFIAGKFLGIVWSVAVVFVVLGAFFLVLVAYKPVYDARESSQLAPVWETSFVEVVRTVPGLVLAFMETVVLTALSVAISTRLPLLANFSICFAIYALGHLTPLVVQSSVGNLAPVAFMGNFIATILPVLDHFNVQAAVAAGVPVPFDYLAIAFIYCLLYSGIALVLALVLFEDRDLA